MGLFSIFGGFRENVQLNEEKDLLLDLLTVSTGTLNRREEDVM